MYGQGQNRIKLLFPKFFRQLSSNAICHKGNARFFFHPLCKLHSSKHISLIRFTKQVGIVDKTCYSDSGSALNIGNIFLDFSDFLRHGTIPVYNQVNSYVISNLETGRLGVEDIASHMCLSSGQLNRKMKSITGNTTQNYVLRLRLEQARILLQSDSESPIADIAYRCGFEDAATFSRAFKRVFDSTPSQMRG